MERVAFLVERTGERIECLLNPASFTLARQTGVHPMRSIGAAVSGAAEADDPLLSTGGGRTELTLELLFDTSKVTPAGAEDSVQRLTAPLWRLAEPRASGPRATAAPVLRFIWGKAWNVPAVITAIAERFEAFDAGGQPQRSWVSLRLLRCRAPDPGAATPALASPAQAQSELDALEPSQWQIHETTAATGGLDDAGSPERIDLLAERYFGDASMWPLLAAFNGIDDPAHLPAGTALRVPPGREPMA